MKKGIYILPNGLTLCGLFCGFFAILSAIKGNFSYAAWAVIIANIFDGLDGWVARLTNTSTKFGIELDSLSDLVSFGVAPGVLLYTWALLDFRRLGWVAAFLFVVCGALRLARFNIQMGTSESKAFKGLPIPGAAIFVASMVLFFKEMNIAGGKLPVLIVTYLLSLLMVSNFRYHGAKEIDFRKRKPFSILIVFVMLAALIMLHPEIVLFILSAVYVLWGIVESIVLISRGRLRLLPKEE